MAYQPIPDQEQPLSKNQYGYNQPGMVDVEAQKPMAAQQQPPVVQQSRPVRPVKSTANPFSYSQFWAKKIHHDFVMRVFGLLSVQLTITFGLCMLFAFDDRVSAWSQQPQNLWMVFTTWFLSFALLIAMICSPRTLLLRSPTNVWCAMIWTVLFSYSVAFTCGLYTAGSVAIAMGVTLGLTLILTLFACQTRVDFTPVLGVLISILWASLFFSLFYWSITPAWEYYYDFTGWYLFWNWFGVVLFSVFLVVDVQMVVHRYSFISYGIDTAVIAAMNIYLDVINMFLYILAIVGKAK